MFDLRKQLVSDFREYIESFLNIRDQAIQDFVDSEIDRGALWPDPLLQLNPAFEDAGLIDELVEKGALDRRCGTIFRLGKSQDNPSGSPLRLFRHQVEALGLAQKGRNLILTTGTGSGKSLCYMLPIIDDVLRTGSGRGIRAVVIYPMNALANSQEGELRKYLGFGSDAGAVTFARYTGQEDMEARDRITQNPPDILLTNFMMLELLLTRPYERQLVRSMSHLKFVVLDELHTYRGRQGADVALLMRRLREASGAKGVQYVGTSATMATEGTALSRRQAVAAVATRLFGAEVADTDVIGETLRRHSPDEDVEAAVFVERLKASLTEDAIQDDEEYRTHPLTVWLESQAGLTADDEGRLVRRAPKALFGADGIGSELARVLNSDTTGSETAIVQHLLSGRKLAAEAPGNKPLVFRLHQFFSPGLGIFATLNASEERNLSLEGQRTAPYNKDSLFFPLCFCRVCGQHYYLVTKRQGEPGEQLIPRRLFDKALDDSTTCGFLYVPESGQAVDFDQLIPEDWYEEHRGGWRVRRNRRDYMPQPLRVAPNGLVGSGIDAWFIPQPFSICMNPDCRASYGPRESDIAKLSVLGMQGRSTATTTLALSTLDYLRRHDAENQKLLSFTDNRQDASLQAGHLNDFVEVGMLRAAIYAAASHRPEQAITYDEITLAVEKELDLSQDEYAQQATDLPTQIDQRRKALRDVLGYWIYRDLRRGWRVNAPNLEQVGLLEIVYPDLAVICSDESRWSGCHETLVGADPDLRQSICRELLERLRKKLAIHVEYLESERQELIRQRSNQMLKEPWALTEDEARRMETATYAWTERTDATDKYNDILLTPRSGFGVWLRKPTVFRHLSDRLNDSDIVEIISNLVRVLEKDGLLREVTHKRGPVAYQLNASAMLWHAREPGEEHRRTRNRFFEHLYRERASRLRGIHAREHTAQVAAEQRQLREQQFRNGSLPILFCSPTMELGVDIADLSVVNLRNVPPTPANYAQRSGRAGRSGQPALVFTYCTAGSPHDQYYFRRPEEMVSGAVAPPRIDLANEDLIRAHVQAVWLSEAGFDFGESLASRVLSVESDSPTLELQEQIRDRLNDKMIRERALARARAVLQPLYPELQETRWFAERWLDDVFSQIPMVFETACERWRNLYRGALEQAERQDKIIRDASTSFNERKRAEHLRQEAERQLDLLRESDNQFSSDFYPYRYFAGEGFLPGYNFPRLPVTAYVPGRNKRDEYLSRPRFLGISEFGPGAIVYHEGSRYVVDRVILPASVRNDDGTLSCGSAKICPECGYFHPSRDGKGADICERCGHDLTGEQETITAIKDLLRLEAVQLRRRDKITCDEEERQRQGFDLLTGIRFSDVSPGPDCQTAEILLPDGKRLATLSFAHTATIYRINLGWKRRKYKTQLGYQLDLDKGKWISEDGAIELGNEEREDPARRVARVVPFVEDRKNALILEWESPLTLEQFASLQSALKTAIQSVYQLEDGELASEPLPTIDKRKQFLFYEASEGGAGVLRQLIDDPTAISRIARDAIRLCHFDPDTLEDMGRHPRAAKTCSTACYDCLMSYYNQRDHEYLNRFTVLDLLVALRDGQVSASTGPGPRSEHLQKLLDRCDTELEKDWLLLIEEKGLTLPTEAQYFIDSCSVRPDFAYIHGGTKLAVFIDGPAHEYPDVTKKDRENDDNLCLHGWLVQRFDYKEKANWPSLFGLYPSVYGGS